MTKPLSWIQALKEGDTFFVSRQHCNWLLEKHTVVQLTRIGAVGMDKYNNPTRIRWNGRIVGSERHEKREVVLEATDETNKLFADQERRNHLSKMAQEFAAHVSNRFDRLNPSALARVEDALNDLFVADIHGKPWR